MSRFISDMGASVAMTNPEPGIMGYKEEEPFYSDEVGFEPGDKVRSAAFGDGEIIDVDGLAVTIAFLNGQTKKLNANTLIFKSFSAIIRETIRVGELSLSRKLQLRKTTTYISLCLMALGLFVSFSLRLLPVT